MDRKYLVKALGKAIGSQNVLFSLPDLFAYSYDASGKRSLPELIAFANSTADVQAIMKIAYREKVPVIPRGAGTNLTGGTVPIRGGIIIELSRLNRVLSIDTARRRAVVEPGIINLDLQNILQPYGFMYAPDPASQKSCTIGGNLGEDAGGPHCLKYGVTSNHICAIELVLCNGQIVEVGTPTDDCYGYDLLGPMVGSEGTMGIATKLVLRIMPLPEASQTMMAIFDTLEDAGQAVSDIIAAGIIPAALELLDAPLVKAIEASFHVGYPLDAEAILLVELDGLKEGIPKQARRIMEICRNARVRNIKVATTAAEREGLWRGRRGAFGAVARVRPAYAVQDATVPRSKLVLMLREVSQIAGKHHILICNVAHAGDGNLHPLMMFDNRDPDETHRVEKAGKEILAACVALGGTISGEHGIGREKLSSMPLMFTPTEMELMHRVRKVFDPEGLLNPGKVIPVEAIRNVKPEESRSAESTGKNIYDDIVKAVGSNNVSVQPQELDSYEIDGKKPCLIVSPDNIDQVCHVVKAASSYGTPITPWGNGSKQLRALPLAHAGIILSLKNMNRILELDAPNLSVEVEAGMNHAELQRELGKQGLYFPLDPEDMQVATIGGSLAANSSGPSRLLYGAARDLVLRVTVVTPQGEVVRAGSKTMKNVAGFDLRKLFLGSLGTLGVIASAVLRLSLLPDEHKTVLLKFLNIEDLSGMVKGVLNSFLRPESMELIDAKAAKFAGADFGLKEGELLLLVGVAGSEEVVERHVMEILALGKANNVLSETVLHGKEESKAMNLQRNIRLFSKPDMLKGKAVISLNAIREMYQEIQTVAAKNRLQAGITGRAGNGILYISLFSDYNVPNSQMLLAVSDLVESTQKLGGFFLVESGPIGIREAYDPVSKRSDYELMKRLKQSLDPHDIFNPGKIMRSLL